MNKHLLCLSNFTVNEIQYLLQQSEHFKQSSPYQSLLPGKTIGLWFTLPSTRTRLSFHAAISQLGANALHLDPNSLQISRKESLKDTIQTMNGILDALVVRTQHHEWVEEIASYANFPVINALTSTLHPCQSLADVYTMYEDKKYLEGLKVTYLGDGNNVCHSLMIACALTGIHLTVATPKTHSPSSKIYQQALALLTKGAKIALTNDPHQAVYNSDVIYTDVWTSMNDKTKNNVDFKSFQVNEALLQMADQNCIVMHCLPAYRGKEITANVLDGAQSKIWQQAYNRLPTQKAILKYLLLDKGEIQHVV